jgi:hypothetical protein
MENVKYILVGKTSRKRLWGTGVDGRIILKWFLT